MSGDVAGLSIWTPGSAHPGQFGRLRSKPPYFGVNLDGVRKILTLICG